METTVSHHRGSCLHDLISAPIRPSEIHVWEFPLAVSDSDFDFAQQLLSEDERGRAARFHFEKDAKRFVIARASVRSILSSYIGTSARDLRFAYSEYGKPMLAGTSGIHFNVSHSGNYALVGITHNREVGVDIEVVKPDIEADRISERFFSERERQSLRPLPREGKVRAFFRCWTCKEAFLKAQGFGLTRSLTSFDVDLSDGPARLLATRPDAGEAAQWALLELEAPSGYAAAAAVKGAVSLLNSRRYGEGS